MGFLIRILPLWIVLWGSLPSWAGTTPQPVPSVMMNYEIHTLKIDREDPQVFRVVAVFVFTWNPAELPGFHIEKLRFLNHSTMLDQRAVPLATSASGDMTGVLISVRGHFDTWNDFGAYPFNRVRLPLVFEVPEFRGAPVNLVDQEAASEKSLEDLVESDSYLITDVETQKGSFYQVWSKSDNLEKLGGIEAFGLVVDAAHRPSRTLIMLFVPLVLICGIVYSSLWWKEESAASRAVMASLFSASALAFSSINLAPDVSYPTGATFAFSLLYLEIALIGIFSLIAFRAAKRGEIVKFRKIRSIARILGVVLFVAGSITIGSWILIKRQSPLKDWFKDSRHMMMLPPATSSASH